MADLLPDDFIEEVKERTDLVDLVGETVRLKRSGSRWVGLCPFHEEKTPSFSVSAERQLYYCFGCQRGGHAVTFLQQRDGYSFPEAVRQLAERAGLAMPSQSQDPRAAARRRRRQSLQEALRVAADYFRYLLERRDDGGPARQYLEERGVDARWRQRFYLGYAADRWDGLLLTLERKGFTPELLAQAGLVVEREDGGYYDRFRHRIIFPIWDRQGRPVGFGGRIVDPDDEPKYLNSPETPLFQKGDILYGLHLAMDAIRRQRQALVAEGYTDVIACHRHGFAHTVASLGTAFTARQGQLLSRQADELVALFDGDEAGRRAAGRALEPLLGSGLRLKVALLPEGSDPDELLRSGGAQALETHVDGALGYLDFRLQEALRRHGADEEGRSAAAAAVMPLLTRLDDGVAQDRYIRRFATELMVDEGTLYTLLRQQRADVTGRGSGRKAGGSQSTSQSTGGTDGKSRHTKAVNREHSLSAAGRGTPVEAAVRPVLAHLLWSPGQVLDLAREAEQLLGDTPGGRVLRALLSAAAEREGRRQGALQVSAAQRRLAAGDDEAQRLLAWLAMEPEPTGPAVRIVRDCIETLRRHKLKQRRRRVRQKIARMEQEGDVVPRQLLEELRDLDRSLHGSRTGE